MPELAEVRTVARTLNKSIVGKSIKSIDVFYSGIISGDKEEFKNILSGRKITSVDNYGKWLFIVFNDITLMSHLRMEGKYFIKPTSEEISKHEHIIFHLDDNTDLRYHDTRKFGIMKIVKTEDIYKTKEISKLGIEPDSISLNKEYIHEKIKNSELPIKSLLLDQTIINGLGNIYVDETLFEAKINPERMGSSITLAECERIKNSASKIITDATKAGGTTIRSYTSSLGVKGTYQDYLKVHTKEGCKCPICGNEIKKIRVGGRGTYYCSKCQK